MSEHGVKIDRVINAGGIPQKNNVLNQIYANVLGRPVLVPGSSVTSLGSAIFAFLAAGTFKSVDEAQDKMCPGHTVFSPQPDAQKIYAELYPLYRQLYFAFGEPAKGELGAVLPTLIRLAHHAS
jgi:L-ribulokinase